MLLPRFVLPEASPSATGRTPDDTSLINTSLINTSLINTPLISTSPDDPAERARQRFQTIDDPATRADLDVMLDHEPFAFLSFAASTISLHGMATPALVRDLLRSGHHEGAALSAALWWLCGLRPPPVLLDVGLPAWLVSLDGARIRTARRRREGLDEAIVSYLMEVELNDGRVGTLHAQLDRFHREAIVHAFAADQSLAETLELFRAAARWRRDNGVPGPPVTPFRAVGLEQTVESLTASLRDSSRIDVPINLLSPWPGIRTLLVFFILDCGAT